MHALVDGKHYVLLESARDHKRAWDDDQGPNTGGMGAFSPANNWNSNLRSWFDRLSLTVQLHELRLFELCCRNQSFLS